MNTKALTLAALAATMGIVGCTTIDPATGERVANRAATGAIIGAVTGAAAGTAAGGDDRRNAVIGAGIGALAGGAVGGYMDRQERRMREAAAGTGVQVVRESESQIKLVMPNDITFDTDSAALKPGFAPVLSDLTRIMQDSPQTTINVIGHADARGSDAYNQALSERRANAVKGFLLGNGIQAVRVASFGMGETQPVASNATDDSRARNRRVELKVQAVTQ